MDLINMYCICSLKCKEIYTSRLNNKHPILTHKFKYIVEALINAAPWVRCCPFIEVEK